jgi:DNA helicase-2/ATP-dependent DNA helicase PcrA
MRGLGRSCARLGVQWPFGRRDRARAGVSSVRPIRRPVPEALSGRREGASVLMSREPHHFDPSHDPGARLDRAGWILDGLTDQQRLAVQHTEGPVLILAAAGSGKTRVITRRIAWLLALGVPAWQILAITFTNKAATEMRERIHALLTSEHGQRLGGERALRGLTASTFHALCARLLRRYAPMMAGAPGWKLSETFAIFDTADQKALMKTVLKRLRLESGTWQPASLLNTISNAKNDLKDPKAYAAEAHDFYSTTIARVYQAYEDALRDANAADFDDLLILTVRMLRTNQAIRDEVQHRWRYLMIDEYQDTNKAQFALATLLCGSAPGRQPNICVVGDPDQAIYGWRGADITNILEFESAFAGATTITLGQNFRSSAPILAVADHLIRHNARRKHKDLFTSTPGGDPPSVIHCRDEHHEASLVADWLKRMHRLDAEETGLGRELQWKDMAVFYRNNALSRVMEDSLRAAGVPYVIARGTAFFQREEVKDLVAYLRVVANPLDDVSLLRIVNKPARKIGDAAMGHVQGFAEQHRLPLIDALRSASRIEGLSAVARNGIGAFLEMLDGWTGAGSFMGEQVPGSLESLVDRVLRESGLERYYKTLAGKTGQEADEDRLSNLEEVISSAREFELEYDVTADPALTEAPESTTDQLIEGRTPPLLAMLRAYLESIALVADADKVDPTSGAVTLMTLHAAKGLEFPAVAMIGLEEGLLPSIRSLESEDALEEERRLAFVGITRAMRHLLITSARFRTQRGLRERTIPSRFLDELPADQIILSNQADAWDSPGDDAPGWAGNWSRPGFRREPASCQQHEDGELRYVPCDESGFGDDALGSRHADDPFARARASAARSSKGPSPADRFPVGSRVRHPQFGIGVVQAISGGFNARATIRFRDVGVKTLVLSHARIEPVND